MRFARIVYALGIMAKSFQEPKGTRDFYPDVMLVRRYIEDTWRCVSVRHGFAEVDGPTFESLDLYRVKSGDEIVSQLFHFQDRGERELALRPEFTPTLRADDCRQGQCAAAAGEVVFDSALLPRKHRRRDVWREFIQWNIDIVGDETPGADQQCLAVCVDVLREFGLTEKDIRIGWNHRGLMTKALLTFQMPERVPIGYEILDKLYKLDSRQRQELYKEKKCLQKEIETFEALAREGLPQPNKPVDLNAISFCRRKCARRFCTLLRSW